MLAAAVQKGTPRAATAEAAKKITPNATSGQKRSSPTKTSSGKLTHTSKTSSGEKAAPSKSSCGNKMTPSKTCSGKNGAPTKSTSGKKTNSQKNTSNSNKTSGVDENIASKKASSDGTMPSKKNTKITSSVLPTNANDNDIVGLAYGTQVIASEVQIVEVAEGSQVYEADQPFRPIIRVDDAKVQAHKKLFINNWTRSDLNAVITLIRKCCW